MADRERHSQPGAASRFLVLMLSLSLGFWVVALVLEHDEQLRKLRAEGRP